MTTLAFFVQRLNEQRFFSNDLRHAEFLFILRGTRFLLFPFYVLFSILFLYDLFRSTVKYWS